jgi:Zn-finger nucleic acid-binding protein
MASEIPHKINKTLQGKLHVIYDCPKCTLELENPLNEAGWSDFCPECGAVFNVPGESAQKEMASEIPHKINKTLLGKLHVIYDCPKCTLELENPLNEAGLSDLCPECGTVFNVPGESAQKEM